MKWKRAEDKTEFEEEEVLFVARVVVGRFLSGAGMAYRIDKIQVFYDHDAEAMMFRDCSDDGCYWEHAWSDVAYYIPLSDLIASLPALTKGE
jgi:hypothetical protein